MKTNIECYKNKSIKSNNKYNVIIMTIEDEETFQDCRIHFIIKVVKFCCRYLERKYKDEKKKINKTKKEIKSHEQMTEYKNVEDSFEVMHRLIIKTVCHSFLFYKSIKQVLSQLYSFNSFYV
jgi:hypothetical protein